MKLGEIRYFEEVSMLYIVVRMLKSGEYACQVLCHEDPYFLGIIVNFAERGIDEDELIC